MQEEFVYVMLKPDTLETGMRQVVLDELLAVGGEPVCSKRLILRLDQIMEIYSDFNNERAKRAVFHYFTHRETEHFVFAGLPGIHLKYQNAKGKTGTGVGIKGRHYTRYTRLSAEELNAWFEGTLLNTEVIDLEMFGRDILHIPNSPPESIRSILSVFSSSEIEVLERQYACSFAACV